MKLYTLGFLFSKNHKKVVLIKKNSPNWQRGKLNGIGGKINKNEMKISGMIREFKEETNIHFTKWIQFCELYKESEWWVHCYKGFLDFKEDIEYSTEEGEVRTYKVDELNTLRILPNVKWLIYLALDKELQNKKTQVPTIYY